MLSKIIGFACVDRFWYERCYQEEKNSLCMFYPRTQLNIDCVKMVIAILVVLLTLILIVDIIEHIILESEGVIRLACIASGQEN